MNGCDPSATIHARARGVAQPGSAPDWGSGGRRFKSCRPDHIYDALAAEFQPECPTERRAAPAAARTASTGAAVVPAAVRSIFARRCRGARCAYLSEHLL